MNSMERIQATIRGMDKDRCAVSLTLSLFGARLIQCPLETYYTDAVCYSRGQEEVLRHCHPDILFGPFALPLEGRAFGSDIRFMDKNPPNLKRPAWASVREMPRLNFPDLDSDPTMLYFFEAVHHMKKIHGNKIPIAAITLSPVDLPVMLFGIHGWLESVLFYKDETRKLMDKLVPYCIKKINRFMESGAAFVVMPCAFANPSVITREIAETIMLPVLNDTFRESKGPLLIHSAGAPLIPFLDLYYDLPGVSGFVLNGEEDIRLARRRVGPEKVLIGNVEGPTLVNHSIDKIEQICRQTLDACGDDPRFIFGTTGADIAYDTPVSNIQVFTKTSDAAGRGKLL
ncbi:hypothetical protein JW835_06115 [bacterium]|nr:hypothetical protein [bacterium]